MRKPKQKRARAFFSLADGTFRLGDRLIFPRTNWVYHADEQWGIVGANGSGKSLLADGVRGRLPLVHGELRYHYRPPRGLSPEEAIGHIAFEDRKREIPGAVPQSRWQSLEETDALTVRDFLGYERVMEINPYEIVEGQQRARHEFDRRQRRAIALLQLGPLLDRALLSLSNGERQRVEWGRALCRPLRLLILDEPFAGLDGAMRQRLQRVLDQLMRTGLRILLVSSRPGDLPRGITHVLRVENCQVVEVSQWRGRKSEEPLPPPEPAGSSPSPSSSSKLQKNRGREQGRLREKMGPELIRLRDLTIRYGNATILEHVDWVVRAGESWALLGLNGAGKSTLLSVILGDNPQVYANDVTVFGRRRDEGESVWDFKQKIGWVAPELHVHFEERMTCFEAVGSGFHDSVGLFERLTARQRSAVLRTLRQFGLDRLKATPLYALSVGLQRLVLLARALVKRPRLLILDEPCQGLDRNHRDRFIKLADRLVRSGSVTVIYVTHRLEEIPPSIRRVIRLRHGRVEQV